MEHIITEEDIEKCRIDAWIHLPTTLVDVGIPSKAEARRLIKQGAVEIDGVIEDVPGNVPIRNGAVLKVGKRTFRRLILNKDD